MDKFHTELLQARRFNQLLAACDEIEDEAAKKEVRANVLEVALGRWIGTYESQIKIESSPRTIAAARPILSESGDASTGG